MFYYNKTYNVSTTSKTMNMRWFWRKLRVLKSQWLLRPQALQNMPQSKVCSNVCSQEVFFIIGSVIFFEFILFFEVFFLNWQFLSHRKHQKMGVEFWQKPIGLIKCCLSRYVIWRRTMLLDLFWRIQHTYIYVCIHIATYWSRLAAQKLSQRRYLVEPNSQHLSL